jgi:hypothetical protein
MGLSIGPEQAGHFVTESGFTFISLAQNLIEVKLSSASVLPYRIGHCKSHISHPPIRAIETRSAIQAI